MDPFQNQSGDWMPPGDGGSWGSATAVADPGSMVSGDIWPLETAPAWEFDQGSLPAEWGLSDPGDDPEAGVIGGGSEEMGTLEYKAPDTSSGKGGCCGSCSGGGECDSGCGGSTVSLGSSYTWGLGPSGPSGSGGTGAAPAAPGGAKGQGGQDCDNLHHCCEYYPSADMRESSRVTSSFSTHDTDPNWAEADRKKCEDCGGTWNEDSCPSQYSPEECCCCVERMCVTIHPKKHTGPRRFIENPYVDIYSVRQKVDVEVTVQMQGGWGLPIPCAFTWLETASGTKTPKGYSEWSPGIWNLGHRHTDYGRRLSREFDDQQKAACPNDGYTMVFEDNPGVEGPGALLHSRILVIIAEVSSTCLQDEMLPCNYDSCCAIIIVRQSLGLWGGHSSSIVVLGPKCGSAEDCRVGTAASIIRLWGSIEFERHHPRLKKFRRWTIYRHRRCNTDR